MRLPARSLLSICTVALAGFPITAQSQIVSFQNTNFALIAGEAQYLQINSPYSTLREQFSFVVTSAFDYTTVMLKSGYAYDVRIAGRAGIGPLDGINNSLPDAAYRDVNWQDLDLVHIPYDGFGVTRWDAVSGRRPSLDVYTSAHSYDYYLAGRDAGLAFSFRDNPYGDNKGGYVVSIYELGTITTVPEPSSYALMTAGLAGLFLMQRRTKPSRKVDAREIPSTR